MHSTLELLSFVNILKIFSETYLRVMRLIRSKASRMWYIVVSSTGRRGVSGDGGLVDRRSDWHLSAFRR